VMAHELAHVQNRDILVGTIAATFAGAISMIGNMLQWGAMLGAGRSDDEEGSGSLIGSLVMAIVAPIAAMLIQMAVSRSREYLADETGARICGQPPGPGQCPAQAAQCSHAIPMQSRAAGHGPYVHRQPAHRRIADVALLHPSADGGANCPTGNHGDRLTVIATI